MTRGVHEQFPLFLNNTPCYVYVLSTKHSYRCSASWRSGRSGRLPATTVGMPSSPSRWGGATCEPPLRT
eukprot:13711840-Heterocapsa_arctica.AAC.1